MMEKVQILNIGIQNLTEQQLLESLNEGVLFTPNVDHLLNLQRDKEFYECYQKAEWVICDSMILYLCSKLLPQRILQAIPGSTFLSRFYKYHQDDPDIRLFLLGAAPGVPQEAMRRINARVGREIVIGAHSPSFGFEKDSQEIEEIINLINRSGATVVVVGVGAPKQEKFIIHYRDRMPDVKIWMALGATIDYEAGNKQRAPRIFQRLAIEWFYRMCTNPRLVKRYVSDLAFFPSFIAQLMGKYKNPFA